LFINNGWKGHQEERRLRRVVTTIPANSRRSFLLTKGGFKRNWRAMTLGAAWALLVLLRPEITWWPSCFGGSEHCVDEGDVGWWVGWAPAELSSTVAWSLNSAATGKQATDDVSSSNKRKVPDSGPGGAAIARSGQALAARTHWMDSVQEETNSVRGDDKREMDESETIGEGPTTPSV
jgi:hypothetical protein